MAKQRPRSEVFRHRLERFPPILLRLLARERRGRPLTVNEIAARAGLPVSEVVEMSHLLSWHHVTMAKFLGFCDGCRIDLLDRSCVRRIEDYLRKGPKFKYLRTNQEWKSVYKPMLIEYRESIRI